MLQSSRFIGDLKSDVQRAAIGVSLLTAVAAAQVTTRVSVDSTGVEANAYSSKSSISADGLLVAFMSDASNLVRGDTNGVEDIFVHDRSTGRTVRVSVSSTGLEADAACELPSISADGLFVAFTSAASNLVGHDSNGVSDVFVYDRSTGTLERVSVDSVGTEGDGDSWYPSISADGGIVAFQSYASNLVANDTNGLQDVFIRDRSAGTTERVSLDSSGVEANGESAWPSISKDGQFVAFQSYAANLVPKDTNAVADVFVHDRSAGITERVSVDSSGTQTDGDSDRPSISADGRMVAFNSLGSNLVPNDLNLTADVFVHDRSTGATERVSVDASGADADSFSLRPSISADGNAVAFESYATNLVPNDSNGTYDVFVHDRTTRITGRVSLESSGAQGDAFSTTPSLSADGRFVAFESYATNLVPSDTNVLVDIFVHEACSTDASWWNYGIGFAGTNGIPSFTSQVDPVLGTTVTLDLGNSAGAASVALVVFGYDEGLIPTSKGGDLLVTPAFFVVLSLPIKGTTIAGDLPDDDAFCGFPLFAQALELDPGAKRGMSFTAGLKLVLGH